MSLEEGTRTDLYIRTDPTPAVQRQQRRLRSRLEGVVDAERLTVHSHPRRVPYGDHHAAVGYETARTWAETAGVSLSPFFQRRDGFDPDVGRIREMLVLPVLWLTVRDGKGTRAVFPHDDGQVRTVTDAVTTIESGTPVGSGGPTAAGIRPARTGSRPSPGSPVPGRRPPGP